MEGKPHLKKDAGISLLELLIVIAITGILLTGLNQILHSVFMVYDAEKKNRDALMAARSTMDRMVMFIRSADTIVSPNSGLSTGVLKVSERVLDLYNNTTHSLTLDGDGLPDADNDANGLINDDESGSDPTEYVTYEVNSTDPLNLKLTETLPEYATTNLSDERSPEVSCERITSFSVRLQKKGVIVISLSIDVGDGPITLTTRALAPLIAGDDDR